VRDKAISSLLSGHAWGQREGEILAEEGNLGGNVTETANLGGIQPKPTGLSAFIKGNKEMHKSFLVLARIGNMHTWTSTVMVIFLFHGGHIHS